MAKNPPKQYRTGKPQEFRVAAISVTPERAEQIRQRKLAVAQQERREAFIANLPRYLLHAASLAAAVVVGILIGRFLLP